MIRNEIQRQIEILEENGRFSITKELIQHGTETVYDHCTSVAYLSVRIAEKFNMNVDKASLIRGALLHDYFLYDWHIKDLDNPHSLHGFRHPLTALLHAREDFKLTKKEEDIIRHHMFPLVPFPPRSKEAWIICLADKISASRETAKPYAAKIKKFMFA